LPLEAYLSLPAWQNPSLWTLGALNTLLEPSHIDWSTPIRSRWRRSYLLPNPRFLSPVTLVELPLALAVNCARFLEYAAIASR